MASSEVALRRMQHQRRVGTEPELSIRQSLHSAGFRYRVEYKLSGSRRSVDVAFPREKVAVFVDGCFWHGCPQHATWPKANAKWWRNKIEKNRERDRDTDRKLAESGWLVLRFWEHEDPATAAERIAHAVLAQRRRT